MKIRTKSVKKSSCTNQNGEAQGEPQGEPQGGANEGGHCPPRKRMPDANQGGENQQSANAANDGVQARMSMPQGTQGGTFHKTLQPRQKVVNPPLGIQPQKTNSKGQGTSTTRQSIEATRRAMQKKLKENPVWKI